MISIIVAIAENRAIGSENKLIYWLPNDLKRFKALTTGHTIIMGRRTFESLPKGALPNRRNIVLSRKGKPDDFPGADLYSTLDEALASCEGEVYIIGGASVYKQALPKADRLCLTYIYDTPEKADTFFPEIDDSEWVETFREEHEVDEKHAYRYAFVDLERQTGEKVRLSTIGSTDIEKMIVNLRGVPVLLDRDLALLYQVEVKQMNRQVKRNLERFPEDFMFQLTREEKNSLKCQNGTSNTRGGDRRALPYAFTQQGIGMLSGLLRSKIAIETNIKIMRAFVSMQRFIASNAQIFQRLDRVELQQLESRQWMQKTDSKIEAILCKIKENSPQLLPEQIFQTGCVWDAWAFVSELIRSAKNRIVLIDNFVDDRVLSLLSKRADGVVAEVHSRYSEPFLTDLKKHNEQYSPVGFVQLPHKSHDRFLIIDADVYLLGASLKDVGAGLCAITKMMVTPERILELLK